MAAITIRAATEADTVLILSLIEALAEYERLGDNVLATEELLKNALFGESAVAEAVIAEYHSEPAGFALFFPFFSTFLGRPGLYLEDLFVHEHLRGLGIGKALLVYLARVVVERGYARLEWSVLDWNTPAIEFYRKMGAEPVSGWLNCRLTGKSLQDLAQHA